MPAAVTRQPSPVSPPSRDCSAHPSTTLTARTAAAPSPRGCKLPSEALPSEALPVEALPVEALPVEALPVGKGIFAAEMISQHR